MHCLGKRVLAFLLLFAILSPAFLPDIAYAAAGYGITTATGVRLRKKPSTDDEYWFRVPIDYICAYEDTVSSGGITWYKVTIPDPEGGSNLYTGYLHGSYYRPLTDAELSAYAASGTVSGAAGTTDTTAGVGATGMVTNGEVNVRKEATTRSASLLKLDRGTVVELLTIPSADDQDPWYNIRYNGIVGYIQGPFIRVVSSGSIVTSAPVVTAAPADSGTTVTEAPAATVAPVQGTTGEVTLILGSVHLRVTPGGSIWEDWVGRGSKLPLAGSSVEQGGYTWYPVTYKGRTLYARGDCVSVTYTGSTTVPATDNTQITVTPTPAPAQAVTGTVTTTKAGVNFRATPGGNVITRVGKNETYSYYGNPVQEKGYTWYYVQIGGTWGYLRSDCVTATGTSTVTAAPATDAGTVTAQPQATATPAPALSASGSVTTTKAGVNLRAEPAGNVLRQVGKNQTLSYYGNPVQEKGYTWYYVQVDGTWGYLRSDCVKASATVTAAPATNVPATTDSGTTVTEAPATTVPAASSGTVETIVDKVAIRKAASVDAAIYDRVSTGTQLTFTGVTTGGGYTWYHVIYRNKDYYVRGDCVRVVSGTVPATPTASTAPSATNAPAATVLGYVKTTKSGINVRSTAGGKNILGRVDRGITYPYYEKASVGGYAWYKVITSVGTGYIRGDCVEEVTESGSSVPQATPQTGNTTTVSQDQIEATYPTLKLGSSGTSVSNLVKELINQGYYAGPVTTEYSSAVAEAVKSFQAARGLTADGVADANTQHALFGTVAVGKSDYTDLSMVIYPAEKIDWWTGGIQELIPKGSNFKVYDVKTGIVWWAHRWSGGNHADIETLTAADTARLCRIYGVSKASQITEKTHWQRRPCLITVGTRTFACALYGVPHNSDGDTIPDNDLTGQICLHFTNSRTHGSNKVVSYNEDAIEYAWQYAPNGHK